MTSDGLVGRLIAEGGLIAFVMAIAALLIVSDNDSFLGRFGGGPNIGIAGGVS